MNIWQRAIVVSCFNASMRERKRKRTPTHSSCRANEQIVIYICILYDDIAFTFIYCSFRTRTADAHNPTIHRKIHTMPTERTAPPPPPTRAQARPTRERQRLRQHDAATTLTRLRLASGWGLPRRDARKFSAAAANIEYPDDHSRCVGGDQDHSHGGSLNKLDTALLLCHEVSTKQGLPGHPYKSRGRWERADWRDSPRFP